MLMYYSFEEPLPVVDPLKAHESWSSRVRIYREDSIVPGVKMVTFFTGISADSSIPPMLFYTMLCLFNRPTGLWGYSTPSQAEEGHAYLFRAAKAHPVRFLLKTFRVFHRLRLRPFSLGGAIHHFRPLTTVHK